MSKDRRPYAQIDVGWYMNPKWFTVERSLRDAMPDAMPTALHHALQDAKQMHLVSILYAAQARTDGMFPVSAVKSFARAEHEEAITALFEVGMWINHPGGMAEIRDFLRHQPSADELDAASNRAKQAAKKRWGDATGNASGNANRMPKPHASGNAEKRREEKRTTTPTDVGVDAPASDTRFDRFWETYPRRAGKQKALESWVKAIKATDPDAIIEAAARYRDDPNREAAYTAHPATWLNQGRWDDDPLPPRHGSQAPNRVQQNMAVVARMANVEQPRRRELEQ